jgi:DNA-binding GntR family transcriptional regulator
VIFRPEPVEKILVGETEAARILAPGYGGSVRRYHSRWQEENRAAWQEYHQGQAARHRTVLESLIARHKEEAAKLMDIEPKGAA